MATIKIGNGYYFLYIAVAVAYIAGTALILRGKSKRTVRIVLFCLLLANLALHLLKQFFVPYSDHRPQSYRRSTMENLCAVSTVMFPLIFLIKKQNALHDFMYFIGVAGGLAALFYPTEAIGKAPLAFDTIRFYFCHMTLLAVPLLSAIFGVFRPRFSRIWAIPLLFLVWEAVICLNEILLIRVGLLEGRYSDLLNPAFNNNSFTFGIHPSFAWAAGIFDPLVPFFFRTDVFGINDGKPFYFPVLWLIGPACVFLPPVYIILAAPFLFSRRK